jgi:hypothetical protein
MIRLPLSLLAVLETLQDTDNLFQSGQVDSHLRQNSVIVGTQLRIEVLAVGAGAHCGRKDGFDKEAVVWLEGGAVCVSERVGQLLGRFGDVLAQSNTREIQTSARGDLISKRAVTDGCHIGAALPH